MRSNSALTTKGLYDAVHFTQPKLAEVVQRTFLSGLWFAALLKPAMAKLDEMPSWVLRLDLFLAAPGPPFLLCLLYTSPSPRD